MLRPLDLLPKAHLHLHFTGSMRISTLMEIASQQSIRLPASLLDQDPIQVPANRRGWYRFQRAYDAARAVVKTEQAMRRIIREAAEDDAQEGSRRLEIQVDPTSYAPYVGGITPALEIVMDEAKSASQSTGVHVGIIVACSRIRHPLDARTLARLAARYVGEEPGDVVGFGLSNDETRGITAEWEPAFAIARRAGVPGVPHGGELLGPEHVRSVIRHINPTRIGHGIRSSEDPKLLEYIANAGITLEVCPSSNVALGIYPQLVDHPLLTLAEAGVPVALAADDPLLFHARLTDQYKIARSLGINDTGIAALARHSINGCFASESQKTQWLRGIDEWIDSSVETN